MRRALTALRWLLALVVPAAFLAGGALIAWPDSSSPRDVLSTDEAEEGTDVYPTPAATTEVAVPPEDDPDNLLDQIERTDLIVTQVDVQFGLELPAGWIQAGELVGTDVRTAATQIRALGNPELADEVAAYAGDDQTPTVGLIVVNPQTGEIITVEAIFALNDTGEQLAERIIDERYTTATVRSETISDTETWIVEGTAEDPLTLVATTNPITAWFVTYPGSAKQTVADNLTLEVVDDPPSH